MVKHFVEHPLFVRLGKEELVSTELNFMILIGSLSVSLRTICLYKSAINEDQIPCSHSLSKSRSWPPKVQHHIGKGPTQPPIPWVLGAFSSGINQWMHDECVSLPSVA
jgi:hypothetical protein